MEGPKRASLSPVADDSLTMRARIEYTDETIGVQQMAMRLVPGSFARDLAFARTFGFARDVEMLRAMGLARGGSLENAVVVRGNEVMSKEALRFHNEFARHKALDVGHEDAEVRRGRPGHLKHAKSPGLSLFWSAPWGNKHLFVLCFFLF